MGLGTGPASYPGYLTIPGYGARNRSIRLVRNYILILVGLSLDLFLLLLVTGSVALIDFEYSGPNYCAFDLGDHFCEFAGRDGLCIICLLKVMACMFLT